MTQPASPSPAKPLSGKRVFIYFLAFFLTVGAVDFLMASLAVRTHTGLVTDHAYEKGLAYNRVVQAADAQEKLGWKAQLAYENGILVFSVSDTGGKPLAFSKATAFFSRPSGPQHDFSQALDGEKTALNLPQPGLWQARVEAQIGEASFQHSARIVAP
jgi:nitrogen fixation protein FixH